MLKRTVKITLFAQSHTTRHAVHTSQPEILVARRMSYNDVFLLINSTIL